MRVSTVADPTSPAQTRPQAHPLGAWVPRYWGASEHESLVSLKLEDLIRRSGEDAEPMGQMERAILGQSMRVVYLTLTVRDEAAEAGDLPPPRKPGPRPPYSQVAVCETKRSSRQPMSET